MFFVGSPLECLSAAERAKVRAAGRLAMLRRQEALDFASTQCWVLVVSGILKVETGLSGGAPACGGFLKKGELSYLGASPGACEGVRFGLRAVLNADVYVIDPEVLQALALTNATLASALLADAMKRVQRLYANVAQVTTTATAMELSVGRTLYELSTPADDGRNVVDKRISQREIAESLGLSREQVNRVLRQMEQRGLVTKGVQGYTLDAAVAPERSAPASAGEMAALSNAWRASRERELEELQDVEN